MSEEQKITEEKDVKVEVEATPVEVTETQAETPAAKAPEVSEDKKEETKVNVPKADAKPTEKRAPFKKRNSFGGNKKRKPRGERPKPDVEQKIVSIRRVTRVMAGGRRFSFSVAMIVGDGKGKIGVGTGKSSDTSLAIAKAFRAAKESMVKVKVTKEMSIPHEVRAKYTSSEIYLTPNNEKGIVAGGAVRDLLNLGGFKNVSAKIISRSKNHLNNAQATIKALSNLSE
jgi:small subunit ribosomal protein S5